MKTATLVGAEAAAVASACAHLQDVARCAVLYGERSPASYYGKLLRECEAALAQRCREYVAASERRAERERRGQE